jgi:hypothetical protein
MAKHDKAYDQVAVPSAGGTTPAGKDSSSCDDALGKPGRFSRNATTAATEEHDVKELRKEQLGSNGMQSNGFKPHVSGDIPLVPLRGFKNSL